MILNLLPISQSRSAIVQYLWRWELNDCKRITKQRYAPIQIRTSVKKCFANRRPSKESFKERGWPQVSQWSWVRHCACGCDVTRCQSQHWKSLVLCIPKGF